MTLEAYRSDLEKQTVCLEKRMHGIESMEGFQLSQLIWSTTGCETGENDQTRGKTR